MTVNKQNTDTIPKPSILEQMKSGITTTPVFNHFNPKEQANRYRDPETFLAQAMDEEYGKQSALHLAKGSALYENYIKRAAAQKAERLALGTQPTCTEIPQICRKDLCREHLCKIYAAANLTAPPQAKKYTATKRIKGMLAIMLNVTDNTTIEESRRRIDSVVRIFRHEETHPLTMMVAAMTQRERLEACEAVARLYEHFLKLDNDDKDFNDHGDHQTIEPVSKGI